MHHNCTPQIIRPDVKSSNILLDSEFHAKIADLGLAKMLAKQGEPHTMSALAGSFGYFALGKKHSQTDNFCSFDNTNCSIRINIILLFHCRVTADGLQGTKAEESANSSLGSKTSVNVQELQGVETEAKSRGSLQGVGFQGGELWYKSFGSILR
ncbi:putative leucine-rich repeat receptor-like protein kinase At2g19210 [Mangifera indica]|uniref:putative leucine-rich repeat receptor-like protein kinase At2g19210 n=1 Tax=Mangifera indica TaxID=29780 RepID=UPI001CFBD905|nr:putative leucine-rich repeat receptor-like protein kinase At2g19210 [Mangifera indica]